MNSQSLESENTDSILPQVGRMMSNGFGRSKENRGIAFKIFSILAVVILVFGGHARANVFYWTNANGVWSGNNWSTNPVSGGTGTTPANSATNSAVFNQSSVNGVEVITLSGTTAIGGLTFNNTGLTTLQSSSATTNTLNLDSAGITVNSGAGAVTLGNASSNIAIALTASQTWSNNSTNTLTVDSVVSGSFGLTIAGSGTTSFARMPTYTGGTVITTGTAAYNLGSNAGNLFTTPSSMTGSGNLIVNSAQILLTNSINLGGAVTLNQTGAANTGYIQVIGPVTITGSTITVNGDLGANLQSIASNSLTLNTSANNGAINLNASLAYSSTVTNIYYGINFVANAGTGTITWSGTGTAPTGLNVWATAVNLIGAVYITTPIVMGVNPANASTGTDTLTITSTADGLISGTLTDLTTGTSPMALTKSGSATLTISSSNTYSGGTIINQGTLALSNNSALGTGALTFASNSTLSSLINTRFTNAQVISSGVTGSYNAGSGVNFTNAGIISGSGTLANSGTGTMILAAANTYTGGTVLNAGTLGISNSTAISSGALTFASNSTLATLANLKLTNAQVLSSGATGNYSVGSGFTLTNTGTITGAGGLASVGAGTLTLTALNTYTGGTTVSNGVLNLNNGGTAGAIVGTLTINSNATVNLNTNNALGYATTGSSVTNITINGGTLNNVFATGATQQGYLQQFFMTGGSVNASGGGAFNFNNTGITTFAATNAALFSAPITLRGTNITLNTAQGTVPSGQDLIISGAIAENGTVSSLTKTGLGTAVLTTSNAYSGGTIINQGTLALSNNSALGTGAITFASNGTLSTLTNLKLTNAQVLGSGATGSYSAGSGFTLTNAGIITGAGSLASTGAGTISLTATNTYTGSTTVSGGTLTLGTNGALTATTNVIVGSGGTLLLGAANQINTNAAVTLSGGTLSLGAGTTKVATNIFSSLTLTANSVIDFSSLPGNSLLQFGTIAAGTYTLAILDWSGTAYNGTIIGTNSTQFIDLSTNSLTSAQLANISFYSSNTIGTNDFLGTGIFSGNRIIPVPEPAVILTASLLLVALMASSQRGRSHVLSLFSARYW